MRTDWIEERPGRVYEGETWSRKSSVEYTGLVWPPVTKNLGSSDFLKICLNSLNSRCRKWVGSLVIREYHSEHAQWSLNDEARTQITRQAVKAL